MRASRTARALHRPRRPGPRPFGLARRGGLRPLAAIAVLGLLTALAALNGCGRKLPPEPPEVVAPAAVRDLEAGLSGRVVTLSWSHVAPHRKSVAPAAGYKVLRARVAPGDPDCTRCPDTFKLVGEVLAQSRPPGSRMHFRQELEPDTVYRFKVQAFSDKGAHAVDSNLVEVGP